jgi:hypothetical protein
MIVFLTILVLFFGAIYYINAIISKDNRTVNNLAIYFDTEHINASGYAFGCKTASGYLAVSDKRIWLCIKEQSRNDLITGNAKISKQEILSIMNDFGIRLIIDDGGLKDPSSSSYYTRYNEKGQALQELSKSLNTPEFKASQSFKLYTKIGSFLIFLKCDRYFTKNQKLRDFFVFEGKLYSGPTP